MELLNKLALGTVSGGLGAALLVILASCQSHPTPTPRTDGAHVRLPDDSTRAIVWGNQKESVKSLKTWLLKRRITVIDETKVTQIAEEKGFQTALSTISPADVLKSAKIIGSNQVVFVEADVLSSKSSYDASLDIRALDVDSGEIAWYGKARSPQNFTNLAEGIHQLTCHALATAWGLRQPGMTTASSVCLPGENAMISLNQLQLGSY